MVTQMPDPAPDPKPNPSKETRTPGSFLGYQYPEWLFILLVMLLPMAAAIPKVTLAIIENAGHMPMLEQAEATTAAIRNFLDTSITLQGK